MTWSGWRTAAGRKGAPGLRACWECAVHPGCRFSVHVNLVSARPAPK